MPPDAHLFGVTVVNDEMIGKADVLKRPLDEIVVVCRHDQWKILDTRQIPVQPGGGKGPVKDLMQLFAQASEAEQRVIMLRRSG